MIDPLDRADDLYEQRRDELHEQALQAKAQANRIARDAQGDANMEAAASHLLQAFHCLNRAARTAGIAKAS